jgi:hypothetical protein
MRGLVDITGLLHTSTVEPCEDCLPQSTHATTIQCATTKILRQLSPTRLKSKGQNYLLGTCCILMRPDASMIREALVHGMQFNCSPTRESVVIRTCSVTCLTQPQSEIALGVENEFSTPRVIHSVHISATGDIMRDRACSVPRDMFRLCQAVDERGTTYGPMQMVLMLDVGIGIMVGTTGSN